MKKIYKSIFVIMIFICALAGSVSANSDENIKNFLTKLNFVKTEELSNGDEYITRGEFAKFAARLIPNGESFVSEEQYFVDVPKTHECYQGIMILKNRNCVTGFSELYFKPDEILKTDHACSILYRIMGYESSQNLSSDLTKGIQYEENLKKNDALKMIYNALFTEIMPKEYFSSGTSFEYSDRAPLMEIYFGINEVWGIITDNGFTSIYGENKVNGDVIVIEGETYTNKSGENGYLGYKVKAYYKEVDGENIVYYMEQYNNDVVSLDAENISSFKNNTYVYSEGNKDKKYVLNKEYKIVYNTKSISNENSLTQEQFDKILKPENGEVVLVDNNSDGRYDICHITSYETIVVKGYSEETKTFTNYLDEPADITFEEYDEVVITDKNGAKRDFLSVKEYDVLSVARTLDNDYAKIIISTDKIEGNVSSVSEEETVYVVLNDTSYSVLKQIAPVFRKDIVGEKTILLSNHNGKIVYNVNSSKKSGMYAYVINAYTEDNSEKTFMKLYTDKNNLQTLELNKSVEIDGERYKTYAAQYQAIMNASYGIGYVAKIRVNNENEITEIDFPVLAANAKTEEWQIVSGMHNTAVNFSSTTLGVYKMAVGADTVGFFAPTGGETDRYFSGLARTFTAVYNAGRPLTAYVSDKNAMIAEVICVKSESNGEYDLSLSHSTRYFNEVVVTKMTTVLDNEGELATKIEYTNGSAFYDVLYKGVDPVCRWSGRPVQVGDLVKFGKDRKTNMILPGQIVIMYSAASDGDNFEGLYYDSGVQSNGKGNLYNTVTSAEARLIYGWIYDKDNEYIRLSYRKNPAVKDITFNDQYVFPLSSLQCIVYDPEEGEKVRIGNHYDVEGYLQTGEGSKVVMRTYQGSWIYVIK